jgi:hypothetical protein
MLVVAGPRLLLVDLLLVVLLWLLAVVVQMTEL